MTSELVPSAKSSALNSKTIECRLFMERSDVREGDPEMTS